MELDIGIFQSQMLWGIGLWQIISASLLIFAGFLGKKTVTVFFERVLRKKAARTKAEWDDDVIDLLPAPLGVTLQFGIWFGAAWLLDFPTEPVNSRTLVLGALEVAIFLSVAWIAFRGVDLVDRILARASAKTESKMDDQVVPLLRKTLKVIIGVLAAVMVVQNMGVDVTGLVASIGIGGLAFALAAKDTVANFFGSLIIFTDQPFQIGDWVSFDGIEGIIEEVGFRTTRVRQFDKALVFVPNQSFTIHAVTNYSQREMRRVRFSLGLSYDSTPEQIEAIVLSIREYLSGREDVDPETAAVYFESMGDSTLNILVQVFATTADFHEFMNIQQSILLDCMKMVESAGLDFAFPTQTLHVVSPVAN